MKTPSLFVVGLVLGAVTVFACRAALVGEAEPASSTAEPAPMASTGHTGHTAPEAPAAPTVPTSPAATAVSDRAPENEICPVMGNPVNPKVFVDHDGRRIGFCCPGCDAAFLAEPERFLKIVDAEIAARDLDALANEPAATPEAPERAIENEICPVMGNPVDPKVFVDHQGRRIGFCCPGCDKLFLQDPEPYLKKVDAEIAARAEK